VEFGALVAGDAVVGSEAATIGGEAGGVVGGEATAFGGEAAVVVVVAALGRLAAGGCTVTDGSVVKAAVRSMAVRAVFRMPAFRPPILHPAGWRVLARNTCHRWLSGFRRMQR